MLPILLFVYENNQYDDVLHQAIYRYPCMLYYWLTVADSHTPYCVDNDINQLKCRFPLFYNICKVLHKCTIQCHINRFDLKREGETVCKAVVWGHILSLLLSCRGDIFMRLVAYQSSEKIRLIQHLSDNKLCLFFCTLISAVDLSCFRKDANYISYFAMCKVRLFSYRSSSRTRTRTWT